MRRRTLLVAVVCLCLVGTTFMVGSALATSTTLELEAADDTDTDSSTVSFTFTTEENATTATIQDTFNSEDGGSVQFEFESWGDGETSTTRSVSGQTTYQVVYSVEADADATADTYDFPVEVDVDHDTGTQTVSETLFATVEVLEPSLGTISDESVDATFEPEDDGSLTEVVSVAIDNDGDGFMDVEDVSLSGVPNSMSAEVTSVSDEIDAFSAGSAQIQIQVDDSISEGTHSFTATVSESEGDSESFDVTVDVTKPPAAGSTDDVVDFGEVLVGESASGEFTLTERSGYDSISGLEAAVASAEMQGSISFPGLSTQSISSGGSTTQEVEITVNDDADRGAQLEWERHFVPDHSDGVPTADSVTFTAEVIYPPYYEDVSLPASTLVFDEPRDTTATFTEEVTVDVTNGGDLAMDVIDVDAAVEAGSDVSADVVDAPGSIAPGSTAAVTVEVSAPSDAPEGEWDVEVEVTADEPTTVPGEVTGTTTAESTVSVEHETELDIEQNTIDTGETIITERTSGTTTVSERLGYNDIEDFSLEQVSGPDEGWLNVITQPDSLSAGQDADFTFELEFDTAAELYTTYTWEFEASGENVETETITIEAVPEPVDFGDTVNELEAIAAEVDGDAETVAEEMATTLEELEAMLQAGDDEADRDDITVLVPSGRSSILLLEAVQEAEALIADGEREEAQTSLVRASVAFNTLSFAVDDVSSPELQQRTVEIRDSAEATLDDLIAQQQEHFEQELEGDMTVLEEAQVQQELARLAELSGDEESAAELRASAEESFEQYSELISDANENLIAARELQDELDDDLFVAPAGQRLFWIGALSTYNAESEQVTEYYEEAIDQFEAAGAAERADTAADEQASIEQSYSTAYLLSLGLGAGFGILLLGIIVWEIRALYRYRVDSESAVSGDFLLPWAETE